MNTSKATVDVLLLDYLLSCQSEGKSERTVQWYRQKLAYFVEFLRERRLPQRIDELRPQEFREFIQHLQTEIKAGENNPRRPVEDRGISPQTSAGYVRALRAFLNWAVREGYVDESPMRLVKTPKVPAKASPYFTDDKVAALLASLRGQTATEKPNYTMVLLLLDTGLRVSELTHLRMSDLHPEVGVFKVMSKGSKERMVPMGQSSHRALLSYVRKYRPAPALARIDEVFLSPSGYPLRADYVYKILAAACRDVGIRGKRLGPHTSRHTFARSLLLNGGDLLGLQRILGHTSLEVVKLYVNLETEDLVAQQRKCSPMDVLASRGTRGG